MQQVAEGLKRLMNILQKQIIDYTTETQFSLETL